MTKTTTELQAAVTPLFRDLHTVWLDLDDTIIDFTTNARTSLDIMWHTEPIISNLFESPQLWAETYEHHNQLLWKAYSHAEITRDTLRMERFRLPLAEAGLPDAEARAAAGRYDTLYLDILARQRALMPGAIELLDTLSGIPDIKVGLISNGFKEVQHRKIHNCCLDGRFSPIVLSDDIGINKPDPRLFQYAMERTGCTDPTRHLIIGDNPDTDIAGALQAGWNAIWFDPQSSDTPTPAGAVRIDSLPILTEAITRVTTRTTDHPG